MPCWCYRLLSTLVVEEKVLITSGIGIVVSWINNFDA